MNGQEKHRYTGYTVQISKKDEIRLKRPSGRTVSWCYNPADVDDVANEFIKIYPGSTLDDRKKNVK